MSSTVAATPAALTSETRLQRRSRTSRSSVVAWVEILALILIALALIAGTVLTARHDDSAAPSRRVRVEAGQTLWSLAAEHPVEGFTTEQTADAIARLNGLNGGRLVAGTSVRVPAEPADGLMLACR